VGHPIQRRTALDRFLEALAYKPWCGDDKAALLVRPKVSAIKKSYIAPNPPTHVYWLVFDLDHRDLFIWHDRGLPEPNLVVKNPSNGHAHLYYAISPVCITENARPGPIRYMQAVARGLAVALNADLSYTGRIAKNPLCSHWHTLEIHAHQYDLDELAREVDPIAKPFRSLDEDELPESRNCALFHQLRYWAYAQVKYYRGIKSEAIWNDAVLSQALAIGHIEPDFTYNEIRHIAKSVSKWVWHKYTGAGVDRGVMGLGDEQISLQEKQRLAATRTHNLRANATEQRVRKAILKLVVDNKLPSKADVALEVGLSRQQITRRYAHLFVLPSKPHKETRKEALNNKKFVTFAAHQITAPLRLVWSVQDSDQVCVTHDNIDQVEKKDEGD
jgi:hypothetical protein